MKSTRFLICANLPTSFPEENKNHWPPLSSSIPSSVLLYYPTSSPYPAMSGKETLEHVNKSDSNSDRAETACIDEKYEKQLMCPPPHPS